MSRIDGRRYAIVGTGARAEMFVRALAVDHADTAELVALADVNPARMDAHNALAGRAGRRARAPTYPADDFAAMLAKERVDVVLVTTVDAHPRRVHRRRAGRRLRRDHREADDHRRARAAGASSTRSSATGRRVTVDLQLPLQPGARDGPRAAGRRRDRRDRLGALRVAARRAARRRLLPPLAPRQGQLRRAAGAQGRATTSTWSTGGSAPRRSRCTRAGRLFFYGEAGRAGTATPATTTGRTARRRPRTTRSRCTWPTTRGCARSTSTPRRHDGYHRDRNVFAPGVTIEDDMAVLVRYATGATMTYHLTAYAPWEGYRVDVQRQPGPAGARGGGERPRRPGRGRRRSRARPRCTAPRRRPSRAGSALTRPPVLGSRRARSTVAGLRPRGPRRRRRPDDRRPAAAGRAARPAGPLGDRPRRRAARCSPAWPPTSIATGAAGAGRRPARPRRRTRGA